MALKVLSKGMTVEAEGLKRFQQEARTIAALNHPHICTLYDIGEHNGRSFLVMEYLTGETLAERLKRGPFPFEQVLDIGTEIAEALEAAHKQGVVHRDVKPGNVILTAAGAKLIDFGLAKLKKKMVPEASTAETASETTPGLVMGTVEYMSPEQLDGLTVDARTDLWGLGVILFEMLTGRRAFEGTSRARVIAAILEHKPAPLTTRELPIPKLLEHMVKRCLAKKPECRWASARDLADQLRALRRDGRAVSLSGALASRLAKLKWAVIGALLFVALALNVGTGL